MKKIILLPLILLTVISNNSNGQTPAWVPSGFDLITNGSTGNVGIHTTVPPAGDLQIIHTSGHCTGSIPGPVIPALRLDDNHFTPIMTSSAGHNIMEVWYNGILCPSTAYTNNLLFSIFGDDGGGKIAVNKPYATATLDVGGDVNIDGNVLGTLNVPGMAVIGGTSSTVSTPTGYSLFVAHGILTEKLKVANSADVLNWSDFVFNKDYKLMSLLNLEKFIAKNKHLPEIPSASEVAKDGIDIASIDAKLLQKIEELTLYVIQQQKEIDELRKQIKH